MKLILREGSFTHSFSCRATPTNTGTRSSRRARMDHLHIKERILADRDVVLVGHVTWVGTSRAEVGVRMEQEVEDGDENRRHVCEAR